MNKFETKHLHFCNKTPHNINTIKSEAVIFKRNGKIFLKREESEITAINSVINPTGRPISVHYSDAYRTTNGPFELVQRFPEIMIDDNDIISIFNSDIVIISTKCADAILQEIYQHRLPNDKINFNLLDRLYTPCDPVYSNDTTWRKVGVMGFKRILPIFSAVEYALELNGIYSMPYEMRPTIPISAASALIAVDIARRNNQMTAMNDSNVKQLENYLIKREILLDA